VRRFLSNYFDLLLRSRCISEGFTRRRRPSICLSVCRLVCLTAALDAGLHKRSNMTKHKTLSLTYKVLTTSQPSYLNNLISVQLSCTTRSSSVVTLSCPPTENHRSLIQISITQSLESTPWFFPSASPVMSRLTSSFTCQLISVITTLIIHYSFTLSLQAQNLPFQQILPTLILLPPLDCLMIMGPNRTYHASRYIFNPFFFNVSVCSVWWTKLATRQFFTAC